MNFKNVINMKHVYTVFKKEVKDITRDKKTLITSILVPIVLMPLLFMLVGSGAENFRKSISEDIKIALSNESNTPENVNIFREEILVSNPHIELVSLEGSATEALRDEKVRLVVEPEIDFIKKVQQGKTFRIKILSDNSKAKSEGAVAIFSEAVELYKKKLVENRLKKLGIEKEILNPVETIMEDVADKSRPGNPMILMMLPMLLALLVAVGGIPAATDLVAGEKERNTFEPLLTTKPGRTSILLAKYLTVTLFSLFSVLASLAGFVVSYLINPDSISMGGSSQEISGFYIPSAALGLTVLITLLMGMTFAGIQLTLSTYAKSFKEAQTYLSFLIFAAMIPSYATMFTQPGDIRTFMYLLPVLNTVSSLKMVLGGIINYSNLLMAAGTSVFYVIITLVLATRMFNNEKVLFRC